MNIMNFPVHYVTAVVCSLLAATDPSVASLAMAIIIWLMAVQIT